MRHLRQLPLAVSLPAALFLGATAVVARPAPQDPAGPKTAVVDIDRVLKSYPGAEAKQNEWKVMEAGFQRQMDDLKAQVEEAMGRRQAFDEGTEERWRANLAYDLKRVEYEEMAKIFDARANQRRLDISLELYEEIRRGIAAFAKEKGLQTVLRLRTDNPALPKAARAEANQQREILYHDPSLEVTDDVIRFLKTWKPDGEK